MLAVLLATPFIALAWLDSYTQHGKVIAVPDVCGMQLGDAAEALRSKNLDFEIVDYKYVKGKNPKNISYFINHPKGFYSYCSYK